MAFYQVDRALATEKNAEQIYEEVCMVCHGYDGSGSMPGVPDLSDNERLFSDDKSLVLERIKTGIQKAGALSMPAKGGNPLLTDEQLMDVLVYLKKLIKK